MDGQIQNLLKTSTGTKPLVSFITVNYKQAGVTLELIRSLHALTYENWECIVVNNGPEDQELARSLEFPSRIKYIETGKNLGFAGGNNAGLPYCSGEYLYFINNDVEVEPGLLEPLIELLQSDPQIGMLSSKIVFHHDKKTIQYAGSTELSRYTMRNASIGSLEENHGQYDDIRPTAYIHGASMMVPRTVIDVIGTMRDDYFLYYEEYDWCARCKAAGYKIYYCGKSTVYHKESVSTGVESPLKTYYLTRNRILFAKRNFGLWRSTVHLLYFSLFAMPVHIIKNLLKGKRHIAKAMLQGYFRNFKKKTN